ncbi:MAG: flagellar motor switch phosphatase FliY [Thermoleophilia bacterium]|nr:flagellar motor switch phosphatase FliY [Thermoleophilia bacterium]
MSESTKVHDLLAAALQGAADVARTRLGRDVAVVTTQEPESGAILRFDIPFAAGGRLTWFVTNEDATGFSDMLIGGTGDRAAVLTEMHLDALTVAFSDMLQRTVDSISAGCREAVEAGELDLGMEGELPAQDHGSTRVTLALEITGFGQFPVVQQADADLTAFLDYVANDVAPAAVPAAAAAATMAPAGHPSTPGLDAAAAALDAPPASAGPTPHAPALDNVVALPAHAPQPMRPRGDLEMLMGVPLPLTVELGETQRTIREIVDLSIGSIIELGKLAGDPLDIKVNDRVIARGEVVVIDEEFGIRVTEIVSPEDRLRGVI